MRALGGLTEAGIGVASLGTGGWVAAAGGGFLIAHGFIKRGFADRRLIIFHKMDEMRMYFGIYVSIK